MRASELSRAEHKRENQHKYLICKVGSEWQTVPKYHIQSGLVRSGCKLFSPSRFISDDDALELDIRVDTSLIAEDTSLIAEDTNLIGEEGLAKDRDPSNEQPGQASSPMSDISRSSAGRASGAGSISGSGPLDSATSPKSHASSGSSAVSLPDYWWGLSFQPGLISQLVYSGFIPMAYNVGQKFDPLYALLPKLHTERCIVRLSENLKDHPEDQGSKKPGNLTSGDLKSGPPKPGSVLTKGRLKQARKILNKTPFKLKINSHIQGTLAAIASYHEANNLKPASEKSASSSGSCWIYPPLQDALIDLADISNKESPVCVRSVAWELWSSDESLLHASDLGVMYGGIYLSLSGWYDVEHSGCGMLLLTVVRLMLEKFNFRVWDLGMVMQYKLDQLGSEIIAKKPFVDLQRQERLCSGQNSCPAHRLRQVQDSFISSSELQELIRRYRHG